MTELTTAKQPPWHREVNSYQWLVLLIASAGWIFDVYEGQIFNLTRAQLLPELLQVDPADPKVKQYGDIFLGIFLAGGTFGGLLFGSLADRFGRRPVLIWTILFYSVFSGLTYLAQTVEQVGLLRFLVAMGVGGEWAVAAALVAEVFPPRARPHASGIFHASSVLGVLLASLAGLLVGAHWRYAYLLGVLPALLVVWVRWKVREPEAWEKTALKKEQPARRGSFFELLGDPRWRGKALLGLLLASVGLGTYWGVFVAGQDLALEALLRDGVPREKAVEEAKFAFGFVQSVGGGLGLFTFGPLCAWLGRKKAFLLAQFLALLIVPATCFIPGTYSQLLLFLPVFGFLTTGLHAGYAIYFPELFPAPLRATGSAFCFNGGRLLAASILFFSGWLKAQPGIDLRLAVALLALLFLAGMAVTLWLPETKGQRLE
ncbi:MAG: MFS transporter [Gemmataceae bacterium]|nr:MFS transporter [Gemmataceae bacterium]